MTAYSGQGGHLERQLYTVNGPDATSPTQSPITTSRAAPRVPTRRAMTIPTSAPVKLHPHPSVIPQAFLPCARSWILLPAMRRRIATAVIEATSHVQCSATTTLLQVVLIVSVLLDLLI